MEKVATGTEMQIVEVEHIDCNKRATIKNREINSRYKVKKFKMQYEFKI